MIGMGAPRTVAEPETLRALMSRAARIFEDTRNAMRTALVLRCESDSLRNRIGRGLSTGVHPRAPGPQQAVFNRLSAREIEVLKLIVEGKTTRDIASSLGIAFKTAAAHRAHIMAKLEAPNTAAVVREAFRLGIV